MSFALGTAVGRIVLDYDGKGVEAAKQDQEELTEKSGSTSKALGTVSNVAGAAGLAIAGGLAVAVNTAASFEQRMSAISAVSGATGSELDALRDKALQLGKDTSFSASESASAMEELVKAGLSTKDVLNGAADATVALAAAGEVSLPEAATIASNAMNQFGLAAKDLPNVADQIAGAANASAIDVGDFGQSLTQVGAVANLAGVSFEDTAAAIALMGNAGIKGSDAGTSLKSMFARLQPQTKKQIELFKKLGLTTKDGSNAFYDAQGNLKGLDKVSGILQKSMKGMTKEQKQATLQTLFGSDAIRAAAILSNNGAKGFDKMSKSIAKTKAADVAKTRLDNFNGSMEQMKGSLETAGIAVGTALLPMLRQLVDGITQAANWFNNLSDTTKSWVAGGAAAAAAILLIVAGAIRFILFAQKLYQALVVLRTVMASTWLAALGPIALIIAAIAAIVIVIILLWKKSETFRNIVLGVWAAIKAAALAVASWFAGPFVDFFVKAWDMIVAAFTAVLNFLKNNWKTVLLVVLLGPLGIVIALFLRFKAQIVNVFKSMWNLVKAIVKGSWNFIKDVVKAGAKLIMTVIRTYLKTIQTIFKTVWNGIKALTQAVWNGIKTVISTYVNAIKTVVTTAWRAVHNTTSTVWNTIKTAVTNAIKVILTAVSGIQGKVVSAMANAGTWLYEKGKAIIQGLINGIKSMAGAVGDAIGDIAGGIASHLPGSPVKEGPLRTLNRGHAGKQIVQMVVDGMAMKAGVVSAALDTAVIGAAPAYVPAARVRAGSSGSGGPATSRIVSGSLSMDPSGRAFITGVAEDVFDRFQDDNDRRDRMG